MITDTHSHLYYEDLQEDFEEVLKRAEEVGIKKILVPAVDLKTSMEILEMTVKYNQIYALLGIHPTEVMKTDEKEMEEVFGLLKNDKVVGIGETGLDYYWDKTGIEKQKEFFKEHIKKAIELELPLAIHTRDSTEDAIEIISSMKTEKLRGQFHCFGGSEDQAKKILNLDGFYISFCGNVSYKNYKDEGIVKMIPNERLLSETDSPFLSPVPNRGKRNEPSNIIYTIRKIAQIKEMEEEELKRILYNNAEELFFPERKL